jgi:alkanesulfonate monooxygenase SsuD/methylene tetrahydromethanopterin reductase-like flavin-dependent oxidoreductase (luciferase family)
MTGTVSLLLPPCGRTGAAATDEWIERLIKASALASFWMRDVAVVRGEDPDPGSLLDPFVYGAHLYQRHPGIEHLGVAVAAVGSRTAAATARAAASLCDIYHRPFRLGLGAGDKPALARMYGLDGADRAEKTAVFADDIASFLRGAPDADGLTMLRAGETRTPSLWLATGNPAVLSSLADSLAGWLSWQTPPSTARTRIRSLKEVVPHLRTAMVVNVLCDPGATAPTQLREPVSMVRLGPAHIAAVIGSYHAAGVDEVVLNLPSTEDPPGQLDALLAGLERWHTGC